MLLLTVSEQPRSTVFKIQPTTVVRPVRGRGLWDSLGKVELLLNDVLRRLLSSGKAPSIPPKTMVQVRLTIFISVAAKTPVMCWVQSMAYGLNLGVGRVSVVSNGPACHPSTQAVLQRVEYIRNAPVTAGAYGLMQ